MVAKFITEKLNILNQWAENKINLSKEELEKYITIIKSISGLEVYMPYSDLLSKNLYLSNSDNPFFANYIDVSELVQILHKVLTKMLEINSDDVRSYSNIIQIFYFIIFPSCYANNFNFISKRFHEKSYYHQLSRKGKFVAIIHQCELLLKYHKVSDF